jgi:hypothetical protein
MIENMPPEMREQMLERMPPEMREMFAKKKKGSDGE